MKNKIKSYISLVLAFILIFSITSNSYAMTILDNELAETKSNNLTLKMLDLEEQRAYASIKSN